MAVNDNMTQEEYLVELINCNKEVCECISSVKKKTMQLQADYVKYLSTQKSIIVEKC